MKKQDKRIIPAFVNEADEARWWYENRNLHDKELLTAIKTGGVKVLTKDELRRRIEISKKRPASVVALRISEADL